MAVWAPFRGASAVPLRLAAVGLALLVHDVGTATIAGQGPQPAPPRLAARVDPYSPKIRVVVLTDIANEPDDQMSMVRFLVYSNQFDVEGLVATTSTWMRNKVRPDVIRHPHRRVRSGAAQPVEARSRGFPGASALRGVVASGQPGFGMAAVGSGKMSDGAEAIIRAADKPDAVRCGSRVWGGANTLAQALLHVRDTRTPEQAERVRREAPRLFDFRSGRRGSVDSERVPVAALHRHPVHAGRRSVCLRDVDRHQRRSVLQERAGRRFHDVH